MDAEEKYPSTLEALRAMRSRIAEVKSEGEQLLEQQRALDQRIVEEATQEEPDVEQA